MDSKKLQELVDREAIRDCMYRYCRGIDRADETALRSSYWPEAQELHGIYNGSSEGFISFALEVFKTNPRNIHIVSNILIEFLSQTSAAVESYFTALQCGPDRMGTVRQYLIVGRYCDRFEKRGDEWRGPSPRMCASEPACQSARPIPMIRSTGSWRERSSSEARRSID